jgi:flavin reductase (DIM6/NTAB) family NADH-FMN oxidoreductase RutF
VPHRIGTSGSPILDGAAALLDCRVHAAHAAGDHVIFIGEVLEIATSEDGTPLVFHSGGYRLLEPALGG